jgi:hypothetical protein
MEPGSRIEEKGEIESVTEANRSAIKKELISKLRDLMVYYGGEQGSEEMDDFKVHQSLWELFRKYDLENSDLISDPEVQELAQKIAKKPFIKSSFTSTFKIAG